MAGFCKAGKISAVRSHLPDEADMCDVSERSALNRFEKATSRKEYLSRLWREQQILKGFEKARMRHQEVHPPCKATWATPTNYITYGEKLGILFALTDATDTTRPPDSYIYHAYPPRTALPCALHIYIR